jgi:hypothetical protein
VLAADRWLGNVAHMGYVTGVYLGESGGLPMRSVESAVAVPGQGLLGDRYQTGTGEWSYDPRLYDDVTLVAVEALAAAGAEYGVRLEAGLDATWRRAAWIWTPWSDAAFASVRSCCVGSGRASRAPTWIG